MTLRKKSKLQKRRDDSSSTYWRGRCNKAWGELLHKLYETCQFYGKIEEGCAGRPEAHHIISRSSRTNMHDPRNGIILCSKHHKFSASCSPHKGLAGFAQVMEDHFSKQWDWCKKNTWRIEHGRPDYKTRYEYLVELISQVDSGDKEGAIERIWKEQ